MNAWWDGRFLVQHGCALDLEMRGLGAEGLAQLGDKAKGAVSRMGRSAALMLPSFWHLETLIAVPHMQYVTEAWKKVDFAARLCAAKPLAARAFFGMNRSPEPSQGVVNHRAQ
jgi:hypothetical protein